MIALAALVVIGLIIPSTTKSDIDETSQIQLSPIESLSETPTTEEVKQALVYLAYEYGLDQKELLDTVQCESGFSYDPEGYNDGGLAYGVAQFHLPTFNLYCKGDYYSAKDQLICMSEMWQNNLQHHWSCYLKAI